MNNPLISVCIPTYNGESFLRECLDSCVAQTFTDFEIIICDDGSSDGTVTLVENYATLYPYIKFYKNEKNFGLVGNWNKCMDLASGTWIKFLFQDDFMTKDCLEKFSEKFGDATELITCRRHFIFDKTPAASVLDYYNNQVRTLENTGHYKSNHFPANTISKIAAENIALNFIAEPSLTIFKKELINKIGSFDYELKQICDLEFFLRAGSNYGLTYIPEQLCGFRIHAQSTTERNISGKNYHHYFLESLVLAAKLLSKPQFSNLKRSLPFLSLLKLKLYVKYKSYVAYKAIKSAADKVLYEQAKNSYSNMFFKNYDVFYLWLIRLVKPS